MSELCLPGKSDTYMGPPETARASACSSAAGYWMCVKSTGQWANRSTNTLGST